MIAGTTFQSHRLTIACHPFIVAIGEPLRVVLKFGERRLQSLASLPAHPPELIQLRLEALSSSDTLVYSTYISVPANQQFELASTIDIAHSMPPDLYKVRITLDGQNISGAAYFYVASQQALSSFQLFNNALSARMESSKLIDATKLDDAVAPLRTAAELYSSIPVWGCAVSAWYDLSKLYVTLQEPHAARDAVRRLFLAQLAEIEELEREGAEITNTQLSSAGILDLLHSCNAPRLPSSDNSDLRHWLLFGLIELQDKSPQFVRILEWASQRSEYMFLTFPVLAQLRPELAFKLLPAVIEITATSAPARYSEILSLTCGHIKPTVIYSRLNDVTRGMSKSRHELFMKTFTSLFPFVAGEEFWYVLAAGDPNAEVGRLSNDEIMLSRPLRNQMGRASFNEVVEEIEELVA
jgi:hypothetical protein